MRKELYYLIPFIIYIATQPIIGLITKDTYIAYSAKVILTAIALICFFPKYKEITKKIDWLACVFGIVVISAWLVLERFYHGSGQFVPSNSFLLGIKLIGLILIAPIIEELFVRSFLMRFLTNPDKWDKVKIGAYSLFSFITTVLFFGFSHDRWIAGLVIGVMLNLWLYYRKDISSCIQAHMVANACLAIITIYTQNWHLW